MRHAQLNQIQTVILKKSHPEFRDTSRTFNALPALILKPHQGNVRQTIEKDGQKGLKTRLCFARLPINQLINKGVFT